MNAGLAKRARELAAAAGNGSLACRAYGCAAVALATTRTTTAARKVLDGWNGPADVKAAALAALDKLTEAAAS